MKKIKKTARIFISTAVLCIFFTVCSMFSLFSSLENKLYDRRMSFTADFFSPSENIFLVTVDQESLDWAKKELGWSWPWPRSAYASITDYFARAEASSLAFDMIFSEPSVYGEKDDEKFAESSKNYGRVVQTVFYEDSEYTKSTLPVPPLKNSACLLGDVTSILDNDRVARRGNIFSKSKKMEPSLSTASLMAGNFPVDFAQIPMAKKGGIYIRYHKDLNKFVPYSAKQILQSEFKITSGNYENDFSSDDDFLSPEQFKNGFVFFGLYAPGLFDICATPVSSTYPGAAVHLCQLDTILTKNFLRDIPLFFNIISVILWTLLGFFTGCSIKKSGAAELLKTTFCAFVLCAIQIALNYFCFYKGFVVQLFTPLLAFISSYIISIFEGYILESSQKHYLKTAFRQYLSPKVIENLIENPELLHLGGEEKVITAYFSDVQGFTSISEKLSPVQLTELLNRYLSEMTDIILSYGGTIDKYEGDAIIAFWGAPVTQENQAKLALDAALACQKKLEAMQDELKKITGTPFVQRIGINTGKAVVGNMGSRSRFDYTMMGDTVNLASRLEGINKQFGTFTLCSKAAKDSAEKNGTDLCFREIATIAVVGKNEGVTVFVPMEKNDFQKIAPVQEIYLKALNALKEGFFYQAGELFASIKHKDICAEKMFQKCNDLEKSPTENWNGILRMTSK